VHRAGDRWHWTSESYPADAVSLRSVSSDNFVVQDVTKEPRIIAEVDFDSAPATLHEKAVYILEGRTYLVDRYDHEQRRAQVREAEVDYYTDAITYSKVRILDSFAQEPVEQARRSHGEVHVTSQVVGFKKIKFHTNENVGAGDLQMPENEMHTTAYWLTVPREVMQELPFSREERRDGVVALSYALGQLAALFLLCDRHDLGVAIGDNGQGEARVDLGFRRLPAARSEPAPGTTTSRTSSSTTTTPGASACRSRSSSSTSGCSARPLRSSRRASARTAARRVSAPPGRSAAAERRSPRLCCIGSSPS